MQVDLREAMKTMAVAAAVTMAVKTTLVQTRVNLANCSEDIIKAMAAILAGMEAAILVAPVEAISVEVMKAQLVEEAVGEVATKVLLAGDTVKQMLAATLAAAAGEPVRVPPMKVHQEVDRQLVSEAVVEATMAAVAATLVVLAVMKVQSAETQMEVDHQEGAAPHQLTIQIKSRQK